MLRHYLRLNLLAGLQVLLLVLSLLLLNDERGFGRGLPRGGAAPDVMVVMMMGNIITTLATHVSTLARCLFIGNDVEILVCSGPRRNTCHCIVSKSLQCLLLVHLLLLLLLLLLCSMIKLVEKFLHSSDWG